MLVVREKAFRLVPSKGLIGPVLEVHGVLSNVDLPYSCITWGTTKAIAIAYNVLAISWAALFNSSDGFSCLVLGHLHTNNYKQLMNANTMGKN